MKSQHKRILGIIVLIALVAWLVYYGISNYHEFKQMSIENPLLLIPLIFLFIIGYIPVSIITYYILFPLSVRLRVKESFALSIVTGFYNLITPFRGGMVARAAYLKRKYNFSYTNFLATLAGSYILTFFIASLLGLVGLVSIYLSVGIVNFPILVVFTGVFLTFGAVIIFSPKIPLTKYEFANKFIKVLNGWNLIKNDKKVITIISISSVIQIILGAASIYLQFKVFGIDASSNTALFLAAISSLSLLISITPAGLGINEAVIVFSASTLGISPVESLSAALVGRLVSIIVLFVLGPIFSYSLIKRGASNEKYS